MAIQATVRALVSALLFCPAFTCPPGGPSGVVHYVSVTGDDSGPGTLQAPWKTLEFAFGQLTPGDTLYVRGGTYFERDLSISVAGTASQPVRIENHPGESPVVDGGFAEFRTKGNADWELHDATKGIYRSVRTFPGVSSVGGYFGGANRGWRLVPYEDYATLASDEEDYTDKYPWYYVGPGAWLSPADQRIYVRLKPGAMQQQLGTSVPKQADPRQVRLFLFPDCDLLDFETSAAHVEVRGLELRYGEVAAELEPGVHHVTLADADVRAGRYAIVVRDQARDLLFEDLRFEGGFPDYVARGDVKEPVPGRPAHLLQGDAIHFDDRTDRVEVRDCTFKELFDAIGATGDPRHLNIHHNYFDTIRDDVLQLASRGFGIEFAHNTLERVTAGVSWHGNGAPPVAQRGTKWIHHNVIDASTPMLYGRPDPKGLLPAKWQGPNGDGMASGRAFGMHGESNVTGPDPWKVYHNTIVVTQDVDNRGAGACYYLQPFDPAVPHEVFNNVFVQTAPHHLARNARVHDGSQVFDGNLYHRSVPGGGAPLFLDYKNGGMTQDFSTLNAFLASGYLTKTKAKYGPGWEAQGVEADPLLSARWIPDPSGPAAIGAVDLSAKSWPGLVGEDFRGALDPVENQAPVVDAGADQDIKLAAFARLKGQWSDDGKPNPPGAVTLKWSQVSGPGVATFGDPSAAQTTATFSVEGRYVLKLKGDDGELKDTDKVVVDVAP